MTDTVESLFDAYASAYSARDMEEVTNFCCRPFLAVRKGEAIHLPDRDAVREHFATAIEAYRFTGADSLTWTPVEIDARELGEHSVFATVHWNAVDDTDGRVVRDTWTSYQLLATTGALRSPGERDLAGQDCDRQGA
jgi:ketosteroid isomerase-like protein